jgi:hypothetical protein
MFLLSTVVMITEKISGTLLEEEEDALIMCPVIFLIFAIFAAYNIFCIVKDKRLSDASVARYLIKKVRKIAPDKLYYTPAENELLIANENYNTSQESKSANSNTEGNKSKMEKCIFCKKKTKKQAIFGILERSHYDNRKSTANTDTGTTNYEAIALVRVPYCDNCAKHKKTVATFTNFGFSLLCAIGIPISIAIDKEMESRLSGLIALVLLIGAIALLCKALHIVFSSYELAMAEKILHDYGKENESIDIEYVIASLDNEPVDITPLKGSLVNRWDISYSVVTSKKLKKINLKKMEEGRSSKKQALAVLKRWFNNYEL